MHFAITLPKSKEHTKLWERKFVFFGRIALPRRKSRFSTTRSKLILLRTMKTRVSSNGSRLWDREEEVTKPKSINYKPISLV